MRGLTHCIAGRAVWLLMLAVVLWPEPGWASSRVALVVGNGGYVAENIPALANPVNDAKLMAKALETNGFEVRLVTDADQAAMKAALKAFGEQLEQAGDDAVGLFYYAGHGVEVLGHNYLIPIGAEIDRAVEFQTDAVPAEWVLSWMEASGNRLNMVILDACRNNPFGRHRGGSQGLAKMDAPSGTLIAYSAAPGQVAVDGEGENSPYMAALAQAMAEPGLRVEDVFKRVRVTVETATNGKQTPWESNSLRGDFYFVAKAEELPAPKSSPSSVSEKVTELTVQQLAAKAYEAAARAYTISGYQLVVERFPGTFYAGLAAEQLDKLKRATMPSADEVEASLDLKHAERKRIQIGLRGEGFNPGSPDGEFGPKTRGAIQAWQRNSGHAATGYLTRDQAETILTQMPPAALLRPKCAELPGRYLGENHAECWEEIATRSECYLWRTHYHSDQITKWTGSCRNGVAEGHGVYSVSAGSEHSAYEGTGMVVGGKASGHWINKWADGDRHEGDYRDGKRHGHWVARLADGGIQEGPYVDGKRHGHWVARFASGNVHEGPYVDGKRHGHWVLRLADGNVQEGPYVDGKRHGHWVARFASGNVQEGPYVDGKRHGHWVARFADGGVEEGPYVDGKRHGHWVLRLADGGVQEGPYVDGKRHGHWVARLADGGIQEGPYVDGKKHGRWVERFADGVVQEGPYVDGKRHGHWVLRPADGGVEEGPYVDGKKHGRWVQLISKTQGATLLCIFSEYNHGEEVDSGELPMSACPSPEAAGSSLRFPDGTPSTGLAQGVEASLGLERAQRERTQIGLWALGFNPGPPDGQFDQSTRDAIRKWQAHRGEETTGYLGPGSAKALLAAAPDLTGPIWLTAQNQPCKVWNPNPMAGEVLTWSGDCVGGKASGSGQQVWQGSYGEEIYEGEYQDGKKHGHGVVTYNDGSRFLGEWRSGKRDSLGITIFANDDVYEGEHQGRKLHGFGTMSYANGSHYVGEWMDGKHHGLGTYTDVLGKFRHEGEYKDGKRSGNGVVVEIRTGQRSEGVYRNGKREGIWISTYSDGGRQEVTFRGGVRHGPVTWIEPDGKVSAKYIWRDGKIVR